MGLERDLLSTIPVWIRLPSLDLNLWSKSITGRIVRRVGKPLYMDRATATGKRMSSYATAFVENSADKELPKQLHLQAEEVEEMVVEVEYE